MAEEPATPGDEGADGVPVDGTLYTVNELTAGEQRELRRVLREAMDNREATLAQLINWGGADDADIAQGITYLINRRKNPKVTFEDFDGLDLKALAEEAERLREEKDSPPPKEAKASSTRAK